MTLEVRGKVREFILKQFYVPDPGQLGDGDSLLQEGIVDSAGVLDLVSFLERSFSIRIEDAELLPENLDSLARIETFVVRKRS